MKIITIFCLFILFFFLIPTSAFSDFPSSSLPEISSLQSVVQNNLSGKEMMPLFVTYAFYILFIISINIFLGVIIYAGFLYLASGGLPEKRKSAKSWLRGAFQGAFIIFISYLLFFTLDSEILFKKKDLANNGKEEAVGFDWQIKNTYYQIPFGLLVEDAFLNKSAQNKFNDVLHGIYEAENISFLIEKQSKYLLERVISGTDGRRKMRDYDGCFPLPKNNYHYSSFYGWRTLEIYGEIEENFHNGIDIPWGSNIDIYATHGGKVVFAGNSNSGAGNLVSVLADSCYENSGECFLIHYAHLKEVYASSNHEIAAGEKIGTMGSTGRSTGIHLHYEVREVSGPSSVNNPPGRNLYTGAGPSVDPIDYGFLPEDIKDANYCSSEEQDTINNDKKELLDEEPIEKITDPCPQINSLLKEEIASIENDMKKLSSSLNKLLLTKKPIEEDLYQLYKVAMLKSLGYKDIFGYNSLLLEKRYYNREEVIIKTDEEKSQIGKYTWDWTRWIENILYQVVVNGQIVEENDPLTFYLRLPSSNKIIEDALDLAKKAKDNNIQKTKTINETKPTSSLKKTLSSFFGSLFSSKKNIDIFASTNIEECLEKTEMTLEDLKKLSSTEYQSFLIWCEIEKEKNNSFLFNNPESRLSCDMEIPVGEVLELTWGYLVEILDLIDNYLSEGEKLIEKQSQMNKLASSCKYPSGENNNCPPSSCDLKKIKAIHKEILEIRDNMRKIAGEIELYSFVNGHFNLPTEEICDILNEDIRDDKEKLLCKNKGSKLITRHELINRKLNYSRFRFDECITRPEHIEDVLEGKRTGRTPLFGPLVEGENLPRYTKTKKEGFIINTSDFNWFCCFNSEK